MCLSGRLRLEILLQVELLAKDRDHAGGERQNIAPQVPLIGCSDAPVHQRHMIYMLSNQRASIGS
jgi:hypothetical protein